MKLPDLILGAFLLFGLIRGIWNGLLIEAASLVSLLIGIWAALKFSSILRGWLENHFSWNPTTVQTLAFVLTFLIVVIGISLLAKALTSVASIVGLGIFNKIGGGFFGLLKTILLLSVTLNVFEKINGNGFLAEKQTLEKSWFYYPILETSQHIYPVLEEQFRNLRDSEAAKN